jgi:hypothetical protein
MKLSTTIKLSNDLELEIEGNYTPEEPMIWNLPNGDPGYPGSPSEFDIHDIKIIKGTLLDLIDNLNGNLDLWDYLTELSIKQIEER